MKKRVVAALLASIVVLGATPIAASATWRQNSSKQWNWTDSRNLNVKSWNQIGGLWYYFDKDGNMKTSWIQDAGKWYYTNASGVMQKGWIKQGNAWYHLGDQGIMDTDAVVDGYYLGENGIMQDILKNKVIFEDEYAKVTYIGIEKDSKLGPKIKVQIENKSDQILCIQTKDDLSVDGAKKNGTFSEEVNPKSKAVANLMLPSGTNTNFKNVSGKIVVKQKSTWKVLEMQEFSISF